MTPEQELTIENYNRAAENFASTIGRLPNYDACYQAFADMLHPNDLVLDLACGPANISAWLCGALPLRIHGYDMSEGMLAVARKAVPHGSFVRQSIIDFVQPEPADAAVLGFGLPYLELNEINRCFASVRASLKSGAPFLLSFMDGDRAGFEKPSFAPDKLFYIRYHPREQIRAMLVRHGLAPEREWLLDYREDDDSITTDVVYICRRAEKRGQHCLLSPG